ncbi:MAG: PEP/pyruvate-binding domain-containing protein [Bacteriovoracia bacterium]
MGSQANPVIQLNVGAKRAGQAMPGLDAPSPESEDAAVDALVGGKLSLTAFQTLAGNLGGYPYVKVVIDKERDLIHFINHEKFAFHAEYIAQKILGITREQLHEQIDDFNRNVYLIDERRFYLGIIALHERPEKHFFTLETVEIDTMNLAMLEWFYNGVKKYLDTTNPLLVKPANHAQEVMLQEVDPNRLPRVFNHELLASASFVALNAGAAHGRVRAFRSELEYRKALPTIEWFDIIVMERVPDSIPRVSGIINAQHTTPLSHTNVLASGWQIPNAVQIGIFDEIARQKLDGAWVHYEVDRKLGRIQLEKAERPAELSQRPTWSVQRIKLEEPETVNTPIRQLSDLRMSDRFRYGTKAANLGELKHLLEHGSQRLLGFYKVRRPPRENLLPFLAKYLGAGSASDLHRHAGEFLRRSLTIPRGIAIPFSVQQLFLETSPAIQQQIGKLKMALELNAREIDPICLNLQQTIRATRMPDRIRDLIDNEIANHLSGVSSFVVRSSSNAEDLQGFSAAGIYESINHVTTAQNIFESIKEVWASLVSPRSVRLRNDVGISLDDCYMGVIVQEEVQAPRGESMMGGVMVTTNPTAHGSDFRNVYINASLSSAVGKSAQGGVNKVVAGAELPYQYLLNAVEGGARTLSIGGATRDLPEGKFRVLQKLAFAGRLLQSHFSPDYTFNAPIDVEWAATDEEIFILQLRPFNC